MKRFVVLLLVVLPFVILGQVRLHFIAEDDLSDLNVLCHSSQRNFTQEYRCNGEGQLLLSDVWKVGDSIHIRINDFERYQLDTLFQLKTTHIIYLTNVQLLEGANVYAKMDEIPLDKAKNSLTIIEKDFIEKTGSQTLTDVLESQPNISISNDPVLGQSIRLAGQSGENVQILIDGVPVIGRLNGNIDPSQILLNNVEKIEIFIGDLSDIYGNNAQAGTINLITSGATTKRISGQLSAYYESSGNYNVDFYSHFAFKKQRVSVALGRNYFDGWSPNDTYTMFPQAQLADENRIHVWKPKEVYFGDLSWSYKSKRLKNTLKLNSYFDDILNRGLPIAPYQLQAIDERYKTTRLGLSNQSIIPVKKGYLQALLAYNFYERRKESYLKDLTELTQELLPDGVNNTQDTSSIHAQMFRGIYHLDLKRWKMKMGVHEYLEYYFGGRIEEGSKFILSADAFVNGQYEIKSWKMHVLASLRYGYNSSFVMQPVPKLSLAKSFGKDRLNLIATYSKGYRAPNVKELYFDFVDINHNIQGNPDLKSERADNLQFLLKADLDKKKRWSVDASYRYNAIHHQIVLGLLEGTTTYTYLNTDKADVNSASFMLNYTRKQLGLRLGGSYTLSKLSGSISEEINSADLAFNGTYNFVKGNWGFVFRSNYVFEQGNLLITEAGVERSTLAPYFNADFSVNKSFIHKKLMVSAGVNNVFNNTQRQVIGSLNTGQAHNASTGSLNLATGRQVFLSFNYKFSKP
ncbi:TonB-dependent receptor plug domain-containing protein [Lishizhenia tianjinensis]|nr:TonB-dependent receptor [Lishizhenia tianjinensis]